jgi:hypothetical protein
VPLSSELCLKLWIGPDGTGGASAIKFRGPRSLLAEGRRFEFAVGGREADWPCRLLAIDVRYLLLLSMDVPRLCVPPEIAGLVPSFGSIGGGGKGGITARRRFSSGWLSSEFVPREFESACGCGPIFSSGPDADFPGIGKGGNAQSRFVSSGERGPEGRGVVWLRCGRPGRKCDCGPVEGDKDRTPELLNGVIRSGRRKGRSPAKGQRSCHYIGRTIVQLTRR